MNKKAKKRAFFVCAAIFVMYIMVGLGFTEKLSIKRIGRRAPGDECRNSITMSKPKTVSRPEAEEPAPMAPAVVPGTGPASPLLQRPRNEHKRRPPAKAAADVPATKTRVSVGAVPEASRPGICSQ